MASQPRIVRVMIQASFRKDSATALYLLMKTRAGQAKFPGIEDAKVMFWGLGTISPDGKTWRDYLEQGTLLIGVGGGPFDEHPSAEFGDRKAAGESATSLVAKDLGLDTKPLFKRLVRQTTSDDLNVVESPDVLSNVLKLMHRVPDADPHKILEWTFMALDAIVGSQNAFLQAVDEFHNKADPERVVLSDGRVVYVAYIESDNLQMWAGARHAVQGRGNRLAVLIQKRKSGSVQIFGNQALGVCLRNIAVAVRFAELACPGRGEEAKALGNKLAEPGQVPEVPNWCYQVPGENMLNGSETACDLEPTCLTPKMLKGIVTTHLAFQEVVEAEIEKPIEA